MLRGLSTAASAMLADERYQQLLANNLANMQTPGFKASAGETLAFPEQLIAAMNGSVQTGPVIGKLGTGVVFQEGVPLFSPGTLSRTNRGLDVAIIDGTPTGNYTATVGQQGTGVVSTLGSATVGPNGRLVVNGQNAAVVDAAGQPVPGVFAARNPQYRGTDIVGQNGRPTYDAGGNPAYVFVNAGGQVVGVPGQPGAASWSLRVGRENTMGLHSFYPVAYTAANGQSGIVLTHDGHFDVGPNHELVDASGQPVLPVVANRLLILGARILLNPNYQGQTIFQPDGSPATDSKGVSAYTVQDGNGRVIPNAKLATVNADITTLSPLGQSEFLVGGTFNAAAVTPLLRPGTGQLQVGQLEMSNVDATYTMTQMLNVVGQYQASQQVVQAEDAMLGQAVSDVGKVNV